MLAVSDAILYAQETLLEGDVASGKYQTEKFQHVARLPIIQFIYFIKSA